MRIQLIIAFSFTIVLTTMAVESAAQRITLKGKDMPLLHALAKISEQTGFSFALPHELEKSQGAVTLDVTDAPLETVLTDLFSNKGLEYEINETTKTIYISAKSAGTRSGAGAALGSNRVQAHPEVTGRVTDSLGTPLEGASIVVLTADGKRTTVQTTTDRNGMFRLKNVPDGGQVQISFIGYAATTLVVQANMGTIVLKKSDNPLDEVQIIAYGQTSRRLQTGNVSSVKAEDIGKQPVTNPLLALQGRVPGLFIEQATGMPGSGLTVRIQGQNSLSSGNIPLYVIDGVPYMQQMLEGINAVQGRSEGGRAGTGNPLSYINPADIESIEVLKDADATSIYGSRAAAGAVLITTKKGKAGKTVVSFNIQNGWGQVPHFVDLLNTQQYLEMRHEALANDNLTPGPTDYDVNGTWDTTRYTDWQKELIGGTAQYTNAQLSFSGGTANTTFLVNGGYHRETTVFPDDLHNKKASLHLNVNHASPNRRLKLQLDGKYMADVNRLINQDLTGVAMRLPPNAPNLYNSDGSLNWAPLTSGTSTWANPLSYLERPYRNNVNNLIANSVISYEIFPGIELKSNFGYTVMTRSEMQSFPLTGIAPERRASATIYSQFGNDLISSWIIEPQASYKTNIGLGIAEVLVGATFLEQNSNQQRYNASGFSSDILLENISAASNVRSEGTLDATYRYNALFGRLNYNLKNKYILNFSARRDGSSRFGSENLFNNFWSLGGAWIFSSEEVLQGEQHFLNYGKLRLSYGTTGNDQIGDYRFMNLYHSRNRTVPYQGVTGLFTDRYPNPYLQWEETRKLQVGLDLAFSRDRILVNLGWYQNRSSNQLQDYALPVFTGVNDILANFPATIQNSGWELSLNTTNIQSRDFSWSTSINLTIPKNKLIAYKDLEQSSSANFLIVGEPFTITRRYHSLGVDPTTGLFIFKDNKGLATSSPVYPTDAYLTLNMQPQLFGGLQNSISYKGFSIDFLFQFVKQKAQGFHFGDRPGLFHSNADGSFGNQPATVLSRWQKPGDQSDAQRFSATYPFPVIASYYNVFQSNAAFSDASYIRLKNLSFSWSFPRKLLEKAHLQTARLYAQGQNLLTFTHYIGLDPESRSNGSLPPLQVWTFGVQVIL